MFVPYLVQGYLPVTQFRNKDLQTKVLRLFCILLRTGVLAEGTIKLNKIMKIKRLFIISVLLFASKFGLCQFTYVNGSYTDENGGHKGRLYSVKIDREKKLTYVTIEVMATRKIWRLNIFYGDNCYIQSGEWRSNECYGELENDGSLRNLGCAWLSLTNQNYGWSNVNKGETLRYTLVFDAIPPGLTSFALVDNGPSCHGYSFSGYTINNPRIGSTSWTESSIKNYADANNDGICGIYEASDETGYRIGCTKSGDEYQLIYLGSKKRMSWWYIGDTKARLRASASTGIFKADWYMGNKTLNSDCYVFFDGSSMTTIIDNDKTFYLKMYPTSSTNSVIGIQAQEWSGTGFALNNGYVVTNYHVVKDANSINISGINGDFNVSYTASVVATDKVNDLAIIKVSDSKFSGFGTLPYAIEMNQAEVGDDVFVLGYPLTQTMGDEIKLTNGIISSRTGFQGDVSLYQMSAPIQPGNSGGPMFNSKGNVVGIVCAHHKGTENVGYAIKTSYLKILAESSSFSNIFPTNNTVSNLTLSGQVKLLKKFVYLIKCSNQDNNSQSHISGSSSSSGERTIHYPFVSTNIAKDLTITRVTLTNSYTAIEIHSKFTNHSRYSIASDTYISANIKQLKLVKTEGINTSLQTTKRNHRDATFTLYFPPIPSTTKYIDLIEPGESDWKIYGIKLQ